MATRIFVNLPVADLEASMAFFRALGFDFDPQFTDTTAACLVLGDNLFAMLITREKFQDFTPKPICDARSCTEVLVGLDCGSREQVDATVRKALAAGGAPCREPADHGFMYEHAFQDLDGHIWELLYMPAA